ncbi:MAG TPA: hypothetical protein EYP05_05605, partial [Piscirickettsiaceae bacterium]|nr:hypothetical protein [Piscirickettsiaceae bacterium]
MQKEKAVYATGYIKAYNEVEVKSRVAGYVVKVESITGGDIPYSKNKLNFDFVLRSPKYIIF